MSKTLARIINQSVVNVPNVANTTTFDVSLEVECHEGVEFQGKKSTFPLIQLNIEIGQRSEAFFGGSIKTNVDEDRGYDSLRALGQAIIDLANETEVAQKVMMQEEERKLQEE